MSWKEFEKQAPRLAFLGTERLNRKIAYLATRKKDGSPRLHPLTLFIGNGMLFMFTEPTSPKICDLQHDGRYTLHCSVERKAGEPLIEFLITGVAQVVTIASIRQQAEKIAASSVVLDTYYLFEFQVKKVLVVEYNDDGKRIVQHWNWYRIIQKELR